MAILCLRARVVFRLNPACKHAGAAMAGRVPSLGLGCFPLGGRVGDRGLKEIGGQAAARGADEAEGLVLSLHRHTKGASQMHL